MTCFCSNMYIILFSSSVLCFFYCRDLKAGRYVANDLSHYLTACFIAVICICCVCGEMLCIELVYAEVLTFLP